MIHNFTRKIAGSLAAAAIAFGAVCDTSQAVITPNMVNFELRAKNGGNQGVGLELFAMDTSGLDSNVIQTSTIALGNINNGPAVYGQGWTTGPAPAGTRGHINGGVAPSNNNTGSMDNVVARYDFAIYDSDGVFQFTEHIDDRVHISVNGNHIHTDTSWNTRTSPVWNDDDGQGGGWYNVEVALVEDGGGAGQTGGPGFAFDHTASGNFYQIDGGNWLGDVDSALGYGLASEAPSANAVPEPATAVAGLVGLMALGIRRRRRNA